MDFSSYIVALSSSKNDSITTTDNNNNNNKNDTLAETELGSAPPYIESTNSSTENDNSNDNDNNTSNNNSIEVARSESERSTTKMNNSIRPYSRRPLSEEQIRCRWMSCLSITLVLFFTVIALLATSLKKVDETEYGVKYARYKKELDDAAVSGGLFVGPPGFTFIKFPSTFLTAEFDDRTCVSRDGLRVKFSVTFQYRMTDDNILPAIIKYRDNYKWRELVEQAGLSSMHHACGDFYITDFQNKRSQIQGRMLENLRLKLEGDPDDPDDEGVNALAVSVQLRNLELPDEYNAAVEAKQAAEEDIALAIAQRQQETTKDRTELLKAEEEAKKILNTANNDADLMLTEARLKANETTFAFTKEAETLVEVKTSLNLTTDGVLTYLANNLLSDVGDLSVTMSEPARLGRLDEL